MSPVMPNPAAEFSPLAMTKSIACRSIERGQPSAHDLAARLPEDVADEEDLHQAVLTGIRMSRAAPLVDARQHDAQLAVGQRRLRLAGVEGPGRG